MVPKYISPYSGGGIPTLELSSLQTLFPTYMAATFLILSYGRVVMAATFEMRFLDTLIA
jgi:hypothetical protein